MDWLNYHHLLYFWTVVREGSITKACVKLHLSQPTISSQLRKLERAIGAKLFSRVGRGLQVTDTGRMVYRYADEIFSLGRELGDALRGRAPGRPMRLVVGISEVLSKLVVYRLLQPALELSEPIQLICEEASLDELLPRLAVHELDLVLADSPANSNVRIKAFSHLLGECSVAIFGTSKLVKKHDGNFPECLRNAPLLLPTADSSVRRALDQWFDQHDVRPNVAAEFSDSALMKSFGQQGLGLFPGPSITRGEIERQYDVRQLGTLPELRERFFAITVERRLKHPAAVAIAQSARRDLFATHAASTRGSDE